MSDVVVLAWPEGYSIGSDVIHPDDPPGEWDWLIALLVAPVRERIWQEVVAFVSHELDILISPLREIRDRVFWLIAVINSVNDRIRDELRGVRDQISGVIGYWILRLANEAIALRDRLVSGLADVRNMVVATLVYWLNRLAAEAVALRDRVVGGLADLRNLVVSTLVTWLSNLGNQVAGLRDRLRESLEGLVQTLRGAPALLGALWSAAIESLGARLSALWAQVQPWSRALWAIIWAQVQADMTRHAVGFLNLGSFVMQGMVVAAAQGPSPELNAALGRFTGIAEAASSALSQVMLKQGHITPMMAPGVAAAAVGVAAGLGMTAHGLATVIELAHPLRYIGLHYLSGFLGSIAGFDRVAQATMGTAVRVAIGFPMQYYVQAITRPMLPLGGDLQAMRRKHNITAAEFAEGMAYQGYTDFWIQRMEEYLPSDPRLMEIVRIADVGLPTGSPPADAIPLLERIGIRTREAPDWWLEMKLALAGYNWIDIPQLKEVIKLRKSNSARLRLDAAASAAFRAGYLEETAFRALVDRSDKTPDQTEMKVKAERIGALVDDLNDYCALYKDRFLKDVITEQEMLLSLVAVGVTQHKARILVDRAVIQKMPKPTAPSKKEEEAELKAIQTKYLELYKRQYEGDLIDGNQYYANLLAIGLNPQLAQVTVQVAETKRAIEERTVAIKAEESASARSRTAWQKAYAEKFRAGGLDSETYLEKLLALGLSQGEARGTVALEVVKQQALVARAELQAEEKEALAVQKAQREVYVRQFRLGNITGDDLLDRLLSIGISPLLAAAAVAYEELGQQAEADKILAQVIVPALKIPFELATAQLEQLLQAGEITADDFVTQLVESGLAQDTAALIVSVLS